MSNTEASEDNTESPSRYGNEAYKGYRKEKKKTRNKRRVQSDGKEDIEILFFDLKDEFKILKLK